MNILKNNQNNLLIFVKGFEDTSDIQGVIFKQLGSNNESVLNAFFVEEDCFTVTISVNLAQNQLENATYLISVIDSNENIIFSASVLVEGNLDNSRAFLIKDDGSLLDNIGEIPPVAVLIDIFDTTFDITFN